MTYYHQHEREDCRRILSLISRLKIGLWWQSREDPRGFCLTPIWKILKARDQMGVDESLGDILDPVQKVCLQEVNSLPEGICKYFWMPRGWRRSQWCFREQILTLSKANLGGMRVDRGHPRTHTHGMSL